MLYFKSPVALLFYYSYADRNLCFIWKSSTNQVLQASNEGINTLATNIPKIKELGRLKFDYSRIANEKKTYCPS